MAWWGGRSGAGRAGSGSQAPGEEIIGPGMALARRAASWLWALHSLAWSA